MHIDMAESLLASWLRHERKCQMVQTNWKIPSWKRLSQKEKEDQDTEARIGEFLQRELRLFLENIRNESLIEILRDVEYCKKKIKLYFSLLIDAMSDAAISQHNGYYVKCIELLGKTYRITSQWYKRNEKPQKTWMKANEWKKNSTILQAA